MKSSTIEPDFKLPLCSTPTWEKVETATATVKEIIIKVATGKLPIGKLPFDLITEAERKSFVAGLEELQIKKYDNTSETEKVLVHGNPFVDNDSLQKYLTAALNPAFEDLTTPLLDRLIHTFSAYGFDVKPLVDPTTLLEYPAKVVRQIHLPANCFKEDGKVCTVLHCDDLVRDGSRKPDFKIPVGLEGKGYHQFSVCIQLEDGGYRPDDLIVYEKRYSAELEKHFYGDGLWRYPAEQLKGRRRHFYTPELRKAYLFSTQNFHDVRGGHPLSNRINFSVFFIYVAYTNTLYYYN